MTTSMIVTYNVCKNCNNCYRPIYGVPSNNYANYLRIFTLLLPLSGFLLKQQLQILFSKIS